MEQKVLARAKRRDRLARWVITLGGMAVIFCVVFILLLIARVTLPLFKQPSAELFARLDIPAGSREAEVLALGVDDYLETAYLIDRSGGISFFDAQTGKLTSRQEIAGGEGRPGNLLGVESSGHRHALLREDGSLGLWRVVFQPRFDEQGVRRIEPGLESLAEFPAPEGDRPLRSLARIDDEGGRLRVDLLPGGRLVVRQEAVESDIFGNVRQESFTAELGDFQGPVTALALDGGGRTLYAGTADGQLRVWDLEEPGEPRLREEIQAVAGGQAVTALALVFGDISLAVGDAGGGLTTWFPVRDGDEGGKRLRQIHVLDRHAGAVTAIVPSGRDKSLLSLDAGGVFSLDHMTSERHLLTFEGRAPLVLGALSGRGDGVITLDREGNGLLWRIDNPHPEVSLGTLFGKVWYEGYDEPVHAWQSSAANDDFEPKLSLVPLVFGTLKGTFYAMIFAVPLALFGAIYASQFCRAEVRGVVKPVVEIMAAVPSVVIGFLAALWLAPLVERSLGALFLSIIMVPAALMAALLLWQGLRRHQPLRRVERGFEWLAAAPVLVLAVAAAWALGPTLEKLLFAGDLKLWLFQQVGVRYDPRNCIIIAFALGFAVIPIIFTISEDALSNVPSSLKAASLAVGASRWQTVWRVILPSASPGIFAGVMIGFGRAVGETMIVLMATGNTAIMDLSMFNGMRPLSANIAVEIPEAPLGGTLYRVLFFSAVLLFLMTFVVNTVAEVVRQRLRKKYGRF